MNIQKANDDGDTDRTAGVPMLDILKSSMFIMRVS